MNLRLSLVALGLLLASCSPSITTNVAALSPAPDEQPSDAFRVYFSEGRVERNYVEIALITAETYSEDDAALIEALRGRAIALNADAMIVIDRATANDAYFGGPNAIFAYKKTTVQALAISYTE